MPSVGEGAEKLIALYACSLNVYRTPQLRPGTKVVLVAVVTLWMKLALVPMLMKTRYPVALGTMFQETITLLDVGMATTPVTAVRPVKREGGGWEGGGKREGGGWEEGGREESEGRDSGKVRI